jgi:outer membrane protein TolC
VRLAQGRFDARVGTSVELTDAQQALAQARADEVQARVDHELATARLLRALGANDGVPGLEKRP